MKVNKHKMLKKVSRLIVKCYVLHKTGILKLFKSHLFIQIGMQAELKDNKNAQIT